MFFFSLSSYIYISFSMPIFIYRSPSMIISLSFTLFVRTTYSLFLFSIFLSVLNVCSSCCLFPSHHYSPSRGHVWASWKASEPEGVGPCLTRGQYYKAFLSQSKLDRFSVASLVHTSLMFVNKANNPVHHGLLHLGRA